MSNSLDKQIGGSHYIDGLKIQPVEFCELNKLSYCESIAIRYICRWRKKNGVNDLKKAIHALELLIDLEVKPEYEDDI